MRKLVFDEGALNEFPDANITFDRFHVAKLANEAVRSGSSSGSQG